MNSFFRTNPVIKFGAISGLLLVLNELILYYTTNANPYLGERNSSLALIGVLIPVLAVIAAIGYLKKNASFENFGQIIKPGVVIGFITAAIYIAYSLLFIYNIEPDTIASFEQMNRERLIANGQVTNPEDIEASVQLSKNAFLPGTILFGIAFNLFLGFITAIITAIFIRNK